MREINWEAIDPKIQDLIVSAFKMAGIDFLQDWLERNKKGTDLSEQQGTPWMSREEAAAYARCSTDTIDNWLASGHVLHSKLGSGRPGRVLIERDSLENYIRNKRVKRRNYNKNRSVSKNGK